MSLLCLYSYFGAGPSFLQPFQPTPAPVPTPLAGWMSNPTTVAHAAVSGGGAIGLGAPSIPGIIRKLFSCCRNMIISNLSLTFTCFTALLSCFEAS